MIRLFRPNEKLTNIINKIGNKKLISIEINPNKPIDYHLLAIINPSFCTVKWITKLNGACQPKLLTLVKVSKELVKKGYTVLVQVSESFHANQNTKELLDVFKANGIRNIYIKRDGCSHLQTENEYTCAKTLIRFIKDEYGDYFDIATAGFPDETRFGSMENQMLFLRRNITAGVNVILTRGCVHPEKYFKFKQICTQYAIDVPIIFGICMFRSLLKMEGIRRKTCGMSQQEMVDEKDLVKGKWQLQMLQNGRDWSKLMFEQLLKDEMTIGVHIFSRVSSLELVKNILMEINAHDHQANLRKFSKNI